MAKSTCSVPGCDGRHYAQGFCCPHYQRSVKWGDPRPDIPIGHRPSTRGVCSIKECGRPHYCHGWCEAHYLRWQKTGDVSPEIPIEPRNSREGKCSVDGCDLPIKGRRLCVGHGRRKDKFGDVMAAIPLKRPSDGTCSVPGCPLPHAGLGWCDFHYQPYRRYKLTPDDYDVLLAKQGGGCAICGVVPILKERLHVDHDHKCCPARKRSCGKCVRGLLCSACNTMLGHAKDDTARLLRAIDYLERWSVGVKQENACA